MSLRALDYINGNTLCLFIRNTDNDQGAGEYFVDNISFDLSNNKEYFHSIEVISFLIYSSQIRINQLEQGKLTFLGD